MLFSMDTENPVTHEKTVKTKVNEEIDVFSMTESEGSDIEEREIIFKSLTKRTPAAIKHVSSSIYSTDLEIFDPEHTPPSSPIGAESGFLESLFQIPFRYIFGSRKEEPKGPIPVIFSAIKIVVSQALIEDKHFFLLDLRYGELFNWNVYRRVRDFVKLHSVLTFEHLKGHLPKLPTFPKQVIRKGVDNPALIQSYLIELFGVLSCQPCTELCEFLELSSYTMLGLRGKKGKEGYLKLKIYEAKSRWRALLCACLPDPYHYSTKWVLIKSTSILLFDHLHLANPSDVFLFDYSFSFSLVDRQSFKKPKIILKNINRRIELKPANKYLAHLWMQELSIAKLEYSEPHRYRSFARKRHRCRVNYFIDAQDYFDRLVTEIEGARKEIFIQGWWISPELHLKRPASQNEHYRLDRLLQKKAAEGVIVYILVFKEIVISLPLASAYTKYSLQKLHPNIRVQRHPDHTVGVLYWAHHEKMVVVDRKIAFCGGIDLCFGRFDDRQHVMNDWYIGEEGKDKMIWRGLDYSNPRVKEFRNVMYHSESLVDRRKIPRMPWHDVQISVEGPAVLDASRHFIERWNFVKATKSMHHESHIPFLVPDKELPDVAEEGEFNDSVQVLRQVSNWSHGVSCIERSIYEAMIDIIQKSETFLYIENQFFISQTGTSSVDFGIKNNIAEVIVNRILRAHKEGSPFKVIITIPLIPAFEAARSEPATVRLIMQAQYSVLSRGQDSIFGILKNYGINPEDYILILSLRASDVLDNRHVTEQIYVHSKVLITDDNTALIGSANINDRSLIGNRDSEISCLIEGASVKDFRLRLFAEHSGLPLDQLADMNEAFEKIKELSSINTQIYRELFHCIPDDSIATWSEYRSRYDVLYAGSKVDTMTQYDRMSILSRVKGNWVRFSTGFLREEDLLVTVISPESLLPIEVFV